MLDKMYHIWVILSAILLYARCTTAAQHEVIVGGLGVLQFNPSTVTAAAGDTVIFIFKQSNHTATQSTFASPCEMAPGGFDSGFIPVADDNTGPFPAAQYDVTDTNPVWVYCRQANHCQKGMVFAINPGDKFAAFQAAATGGTASSAAPAQTSSASSPPPAAATTLSVPPPSAPSSTASPSVTFASPAPSGSAKPTAISSDHRVVVGGPNKVFFSPSNITAQVGDTVTFVFQQKNHTATQSTFAQPCVPLTHTSTSGQIGFDSGFMPVPDNSTASPIFTIQINDTSPIWAYCRQANHCGSGMVFSVNAPESGSNTFDAFLARAKQLNGTGSNSSSTSSAGPTRATVLGTGRCAGFAAAVVALLFGLLL